MKKHFLILGLIFMFFGLVTYAQTTVSIPDTTVARGAVSLPVSVIPDIGDVGSITLHISYDETVVEFTGFTDNPFDGDPNFLVTDTGGQLNIVWFGTTPVEITNKLFNLEFIYSGGTSALTFVGTNEITDENAQAYNINFTLGSIDELPATLTLSDEIGVPDQAVTVSMTAQNLIDVGSMTLFLSYDETVAEFVEVQNDALGFSIDSETDGVLTLAWFSTTPATINSGTVIDLVFDVLTENNTAVEFMATTEITDADGDPMSVILNDGSISPPSASFGFQNVKTAAFSEVSVPLQGTLLEDIGSFTFDIQFDPLVMDYFGFENLVSGSLEARVVSPGVLRLAYFNTSGLSLVSGDIVDLVFDYVYNDPLKTTEISIDDVTAEVTNTAGDVLGGIIFLSGTITENIPPMFTSVLPDTTIWEEQTLTHTFAASDSDATDMLMFFAYPPVDPGHPVFTVDPTTGYFEWTPSATEDGLYLLGVGVTDGYDTAYTGAFITVLNNNEPPVFNNVIADGERFTPESTPSGWTEYSFTYTATDPEGDDITFTLVEGPTGASITEDGLFTWAPTDAEANQEDLPITVKVSDGDTSTTHTSLVSTDEVVGVSGEVMPTEYSLNQNYPNPFNPSTSIRFGIPHAADVSLKIFNILGQEVKTLLNKNLAAGFHTVNFNASDLISGMYIYRIQAQGVDGSNFLDVKKMLLVK